jgi:dTDP-4-dehydrorhamnose reductase
VVITGGQGQLAGHLTSVFSGHEVRAPGRDVLDITDRYRVQALMDEWTPDYVINTAAYHNVDLCESEPELSFAVNAAAVQRLAVACERHGTMLVHISTDYVFGGLRSTPYREDDPVGPVNVYGCSKAAGEMAIRCTTERHLIVRTTGLYGRPAAGARRRNFVEAMLHLAARGEKISVVSDQVLTPSFCQDVAEAIGRLVFLGATGTFHVTNGGACSWYEFAREIFRLSGLTVDLEPIPQSAWPVPARRPVYSVLENAGLRRVGLPALRPWQEALSAYISGRNE